MPTLCCLRLRALAPGRRKTLALGFLILGMLFHLVESRHPIDRSKFLSHRCFRGFSADETEGVRCPVQGVGAGAVPGLARPVSWVCTARGAPGQRGVLLQTGLPRRRPGRPCRRPRKRTQTGKPSSPTERLPLRAGSSETVLVDLRRSTRDKSSCERHSDFSIWWCQNVFQQKG